MDMGMNGHGHCVIIGRLLICTENDAIMLQGSKFLSIRVCVIVSWMIQTFKPFAEINV